MLIQFLHIPNPRIFQTLVHFPKGTTRTAGLRFQLIHRYKLQYLLDPGPDPDLVSIPKNWNPELSNPNDDHTTYITLHKVDTHVTEKRLDSRRPTSDLPKPPHITFRAFRRF